MTSWKAESSGTVLSVSWDRAGTAAAAKRTIAIARYLFNFIGAS
jgi:hypothetical protein